jgi:predicted O-methyltransferase YrrM
MLLRRDAAVALAVAVAFAAASLALERFLPARAGTLALSLLLLLFLLALAAAFRPTQALLAELFRNYYRQTEALFSLFTFIRPKEPLPPMRDWAICPDFANLLVSVIHRRKPQFILDLGSGVSTLICGYLLKEQGSGTVLGIEHDPDYAQRAERALSDHGLTGFARVRLATLRETTLEGGTWNWYEGKAFEDLPPIDLLIVDGPPSPLQRLSRYPALEVLHGKLAPGAVVLLDDALRKDERAILKMWLDRFPEFRCELVSTEKGAAVLERT